MPKTETPLATTKATIEAQMAELHGFLDDLDKKKVEAHAKLDGLIAQHNRLPK